MGIIKHFFTKNPEIRDKAKELYETFENYSQIFEHKKNILTTHMPGDSILAFKKLFENWNKKILIEIKKEGVEETIVESLGDELLTGREKSDIVNISEILRRLKESLETQQNIIDVSQALLQRDEELRKEDPYGINDETHQVWDELKQKVEELKYQVEVEQSLLYGERGDVEELRELIINNKDFPLIEKVKYPAIEAASMAESYISTFYGRRLSLKYLSKIPPRVSRRKGRIFYPGSGSDILVIFCFPNCEEYILQDPQKGCENELTEYLKILNRTNIIQELKTERNKHEFIFNGQKKLLTIYTGQKGFSNRFVPSEVRDGVDIVMTKAYTIDSEIKKQISSRIIPYVRKKALLTKEFILGLEDTHKFKEFFPGWVMYLGKL